MPGGRLVLTDCSSACRSLRLFERTGYLFGRARGPCRPGTAYVRAALKRPPAVVAGGPEITSKTAAKSPFSWYYIGKGTSESAAVDVEVGISLSTVQRRLLDVFVVQDYSSHSPPVTRAGCFNSAFLHIYLRKLNTTVLDAAHRAVFCCFATSLGPQPTSQSSGPGRASAAPAMLPPFLWSRRSDHRRRAG